MSKYISKITVQNEDYNIKDAELRLSSAGMFAQVNTNTDNIAINADKIAALEEIVKGGVHFRGKLITELSGEGDTTNPVQIEDAESGSKTLSAIAGDMVIGKNGTKYESTEFIWDSTEWLILGDITGLGELAFVDQVSSTYTPSGSVTINDKGTVDLTCSTEFTGNDITVITDVKVNEVTATATFNGTELTGIGATVTMNACTPTASFSKTVLPTGTSTVSVKQPTGGFSGTAGTVTVAGVPTGTVAAPTITATQGKKSVLETAIVADGTEILSFGTIEVLSSITNLAATAPTFTGTSFNSTGTFTPQGTVNTETSSLTCNLTLNQLTVSSDVTVDSFTPTVQSATVNNFTPQGSIAVAKFTPTTNITSGSKSITGSVMATATVPAHNHTGSFTGAQATITSNAVPKE